MMAFNVAVHHLGLKILTPRLSKEAGSCGYIKTEL
jgi:hypothetical protein